MAREIIFRFCKKEELPTRSLLQKYRPEKSWFLKQEMVNSIHGIGHETRVLVWQEILSRYVINSENMVDQEALRWSAVTHDTQRKNHYTDYEHGIRSAQWVKEEMKSVIAEKSLDEVYYLNQNHVPEDLLIKEIKPELLILKDADALDRLRIANDLNPLKLRLPITEKLIKKARLFCERTRNLQNFDQIIDEAVRINLVLEG
jgi:hypothetical protein